MLWQRSSNAKEYEKSPLPPERVNRNAEEEPPDQFKIGEKIESASRRESLQVSRHVNPALHPEWSWSCQWI